MRRVKKVKKKFGNVIGRDRQISLIRSLQYLGYSLADAEMLIRTGRILVTTAPNDRFIRAEQEIYVLDPKQEIEETDTVLDRGHLVDLE